MKYSALLAALMTVFLAGCGESNQQPPQIVQQPQYQQQATAATPQYAPAPVMVQQAPAGGHDGTDMLMAGAVGYLAGNMMGGGGRSNYAPTTVVHQTVIHQTPTPAPRPTYTYRPSPAYRSSFGRSSSFSSFRSFGGRR